MRKIEVKGTIVGNADKWIYEWFGMDATCPKDVNAAIGEANGEPLLVKSTPAVVMCLRAVKSILL